MPWNLLRGYTVSLIFHWHHLRSTFACFIQLFRVLGCNQHCSHWRSLMWLLEIKYITGTEVGMYKNITVFCIWIIMWLWNMPHESPLYFFTFVSVPKILRVVVTATPQQTGTLLCLCTTHWMAQNNWNGSITSHQSFIEDHLRCLSRGMRRMLLKMDPWSWQIWRNKTEENTPLRFLINRENQYRIWKAYVYVYWVGNNKLWVYFLLFNQVYLDIYYCASYFMLYLDQKQRSAAT